jgi:germination protein YpeB
LLFILNAKRFFVGIFSARRIFMKITKKAAILVSTYVIAGFLVLGGFLYNGALTAKSLRRQVALNYDHAFSELTNAVNELDAALSKAVYASSPSQVSSLCAKAYCEAENADAALGVLPYGNIELEHTAAYLAKAGDYAYYLSRSAAAGKKLTDDERENLSKLRDSADLVSETLSGLYAEILTGGVSISDLEKAESAISECEDSIIYTELTQSFKQLETDFPEFPTLIYDGPFSEHIKTASPKLLEGESDISEEAAIDAAAKLLDMEPSRFSVDYQREGTVPVYVVTGKSGGDTLTIEVTRAGGKVSYFGTTHQVHSNTISPEECVKIAERFLAKKGYDNMSVTYWSQQSGDVIINFAYEQDGIIVYPDLIKVSVAMDTGSISGFEALGYIMSHYDRTASEQKVSAEEVKANISSNLTVKSQRLAIIPTSGGDEVFCHELLCEDGDGSQCLIYVNAETGNEEKILLLIEDESGKLTI